MHPYLNIAIKAARAAGNVILRYADRIDTLSIERKSRNDFVSEVDKLAESEILRIVQHAYPDHRILAEESGRQGDGDHHEWIIDPLDGTTNFLHGFPHYAVSIGVRKGNKLEHAVVFDPMRDELFTASRGEGAQLNNRRIRVSGVKILNDALLTTGFPFRDDQDAEQWIHSFRQLQNRTSGIRRPGSAALDLAHVACGRFEAFWEQKLNIWDIAAGVLLVEEAGGLVSDWQGGRSYFDSGDLVAGNPAIHAEMIRLIR